MNNEHTTNSAIEKALRLNLDHRTYGTIAEIGAGQEVARYFFHSGAAKAYKSTKSCQGWMGIKLQTESQSEPSNIILHVNLLDSTNLAQQRALGVLGVNLIYAAFHFINDPNMLIDSLFDNLTWGRIELDFIEFSGPGFEKIDNRKMMLRLVESSLTPIVMFGKTGNGILFQHILKNRGIIPISIEENL